MSRTLDAALKAAVDATGAASGWLLRSDGDELAVVASSVADLVGTRREARGVAGLAMASGQPAAVQLRPGDSDNEGAAARVGLPGALLVVPCVSDDVLGVIELADPPGGAFTFDDVETVALIADIAAAALSEASPEGADEDDANLALARMRNAAPDHYDLVVRLIQELG